MVEAVKANAMQCLLLASTVLRMTSSLRIPLLVAFVVAVGCESKPLRTRGGVAQAEATREDHWPSSKRWTCLGLTMESAVDGELRLEVVDVRGEPKTIGAATVSVIAPFAEIVVAFRTTEDKAMGPGELQFCDVEGSRVRVIASVSVEPVPGTRRDDCVPPRWEEQLRNVGRHGRETIRTWSWNGPQTDHYADALIGDGDFQIMDLQLDTDVGDKPLAQWPRPVWALWSTFTPRPRAK
jgi:hypothetical protein